MYFVFEVNYLGLSKPNISDCTIGFLFCTISFCKNNDCFENFIFVNAILINENCFFETAIFENRIHENNFGDCIKIFLILFRLEIF